MYVLTPLPPFNDLQNYVQTISNLLKEEHRDKWEEAQLVRDKREYIWVVHSEYEQGKFCSADVLVMG